MKARYVLAALAVLMLSLAVSLPAVAQAANPVISFVAVRSVKGGNIYDLMVMNGDGSDQKAIMSTPAWVGVSSWSPLQEPITNGYKRRLVFEINRTLWLIDVNVVNGTIQTPVTPTLLLSQMAGLSFTDPAWSPDGNWIAFTASGTPAGGIYVIQPDGSQLTQVVPLPPRGLALSPSWKPDSRSIAYRWKPDSNGGYRNLVISQVISDDGTTPTIRSEPDSIVVPEEAGFSNLHGIDWSRSGDWIAFSESGFKTPAIYIVPPSPNGNVQSVPLTTDSSSPTWSPDDNYLVYSKNGKIVRQNMTTHQETVLATMKNASLMNPDYRR